MTTSMAAYAGVAIEDPDDKIAGCLVCDSTFFDAP